MRFTYCLSLAIVFVVQSQRSNVPSVNASAASDVYKEQPLRPIKQKCKRYLTAVALPVGDRLPVSVGASRFPVEEGGPITLRPSLNYGTFPRQLLKIEEPFLASSLLSEEPFLEKLKKLGTFPWFRSSDRRTFPQKLLKN